ncbi:MAG: alpha/beta hydrolase [Cyanobacteria bacterium REEB67]|nr:alpha/beta hydrolase [Cyanobacteria bacterium REEB67]
MFGKKLIFSSLSMFVGLSLSGLSFNSPAFAGNLHQEHAYGAGNVTTYSLGDSRVESIAMWRVPEGKQKAIVLSLHGFGLHKCVYQALAEKLQAVGVATYAMDIRGFGSWSQEAGGAAAFSPEKTLADVKSALTALREENPDTPVFLLGESLGGALALKAAAENPSLVDGVIASVPAADRYKAKRVAFGLALKNLLGAGGHVNIGKGLISQATHDPSLKSAWQNDPSARLKVSTRELLTFSRFMHHNHQVAGQIKTTAVLILQGANDRLVKASGTARLFNELGTTDKDYLLVDNSEHLILEEGQFTASTFKHIDSWLAVHEDMKVASRHTIPTKPAFVDLDNAVLAVR